MVLTISTFSAFPTVELGENSCSCDYVSECNFKSIPHAHFIRNLYEDFLVPVCCNGVTLCCDGITFGPSR